MASLRRNHNPECRRSLCGLCHHVAHVPASIVTRNGKHRGCGGRWRIPTEDDIEKGLVNG